PLTPKGEREKVALEDGVGFASDGDEANDDGAAGYRNGVNLQITLRIARISPAQVFLKVGEAVVVCVKRGVCWIERVKAICGFPGVRQAVAVRIVVGRGSGAGCWGGGKPVCGLVGIAYDRPERRARNA